MPTVDLDLATQHLIALGLRTLATGSPVTNILVVIAEPGIVADMLSTLLPDMVVGTTDARTVVCVLAGDAREAMLRALPHIRVACDRLDDHIPVIVIEGRMLTMTAVRVPRGQDRRWSS